MGFPFFSQDHTYRRLPLNPPESLPQAVESLSWNTAGGQIRFRATLSRLALRVSLRDVSDMYHMPPSGQSGFDCYVSEAGGKIRYASTTMFAARQQRYEAVLLDFATPRTLDITLNFPLYMGVHEVHVGLDDDAQVSAPAPLPYSGRIVFYGSSITQGGCAARPGMAYTNILSRRMERECINLGFSGSGKGERAVALALREIDRTDLLVLDFDANCPDAEWMRTKLPEFISLYRERHPHTPILLVSRIAYAQAHFNEQSNRTQLEKREYQRLFVEQARQDGDVNIHFMDGLTIFDDQFDEYTVDGVHPTDLGFMKMAESFQPVLEKLL